MQRVLKKNYTLYADYSGKRVKLYSGILEEIDDFTTYFVDKNAIRKRLVKNGFGEFLVYIESSRGKYYSAMYYNNRAILDKENFNRIYEKIEKIDREKIKTLLEKYKSHEEIYEFLLLCLEIGTIKSDAMKFLIERS